MSSKDSRMEWPSWLKLIRRKPAAAASRTTCPTCGKEMTLVEKTTMTGSDMRTYRCDRCEKEHVVNFGPALWKVLHDARESEDDAA